jgi:hypothetical protein
MRSSMSPEEKRLFSLLKHTERVYDNCKILAQALLERGEDTEFVRQLIYNGKVHDDSKFFPPEWNFLSNGCDSNNPQFKEAWLHHVLNNSHHPEFWGDIHNMPRLALAELTVDWLSRSSELRSKGLSQWIEEDAMPRYKFDKHSTAYKEIDDFLSLLLEPAFA